MEPSSVPAFDYVYKNAAKFEKEGPGSGISATVSPFCVLSTIARSDGCGKPCAWVMPAAMSSSIASSKMSVLDLGTLNVYRK